MHAAHSLRLAARWVALCLPLMALLSPAWMQWRHPLHAVSPADALAGWTSSPLLLTLAGLCACWAMVGQARRARWLLAPLALLAPAEALYVAHFGVPSGAHVYAVVAETHSEELSSFIGADALLYLALLLAWAGLLIWTFRRWGEPNWGLSGRARGLLAALASAVLLPQALGHWLATRLPDPVEAEFGAAPLPIQHAMDLQQPGFVTHLEMSYPWGLPQRLLRWAEHREAARRHAEMAGAHRFRLQAGDALPPDAPPQVVVMVIGEASRADRWQLYGAARATTPRLQARRAELLVFRDAVSAASATRESVSLMLTRRPPEQVLGMRAEGSVVSAFRQAGFKTYWLSTQGSAGPHETPVAVMAAEAHERRFLSRSDYRGQTALDGELLPQLAQVLARREPRVFIVLHTLGSHLHYANRYPLGAEPFRPALQRDDPPNIWRKERFEELVNAYDNSLHHTDLVLDGAIAHLQASGADAHLSYMPDHGETLFDGRCPRGGHGFASIANYRVPLLMWASAGWKARHPARWALLDSRQQQPVSALALFPTLLGHAGVQLHDPVAHPDLGAPDWRRAPRTTAHFGDFDRSLAPQACDAG